MQEKTFNRVLEIDLIRGIAIIFMIFDHFMYDSVFLMRNIFIEYGGNNWTKTLEIFAYDYWTWDVRIIVRQFIVFLFLALTGICCSFSKNNLKRGLMLLGISLLLTLGTYIAGLIINDVNITIMFGVLHCIALALIIISILELFIKKFKYDKYIYLVIGIIMMSFGIYFYYNYIFVFYEGENLFLLFIHILIGDKLAGSDCFPFLLYGGEIFIGVFLGKLLYKEKKSLFNFNYQNNVITFIGRHSLIFYFAHQIIITGLFIIILLIMGFHFI